MSILRGPKVPRPYGLPANTIHGVLEHFVENDAAAKQKTAVIYQGQATTYIEFNKHANVFARVIKERLNTDKQPAGRVCIGLHIHPSDTVLKLIFSILKLGASYFPLDPTYPVKRLRYTMADSRPCCIITADSDGEIVEILRDIPETEKPVVITVRDLMSSIGVFPDSNLEESEQIVQHPIGFSSLATVLYTSGSTGVPKGVLIPHRSILHRCSGLWSSFHIKDSDIFCLKSSINFVDSQTEIFGALLRGIPLVVAPAKAAKNPTEMIKVLDDNKVTWIMLVPSLLHTMLITLKNKGDEQSYNMLQSVKMFVSDGEILSPRLVDLFYACLPNSHIVNVWGMTELAGDLTIFLVNKTHASRTSQISIGQPIQNTNIYLLDEKRQPVPIGETGICHVSGPNVSDGYLVKNDSGTQSANPKHGATFSLNPFETDPEHMTLFTSGDYMKLVLDETTKELTLMFVGRRDTMVKYHGLRVDLNELQSGLSDNPCLERVVVCCHSHLEEQYLVAYCKVYEDARGCTAETITSYLQSIVPAYMLPRIILVDDFPKQPNGKTSNHGLFEIFKASLTGISNIEPSQIIYDENSPLAGVIKRVVRDVLRLPFEVSLSHNYFQLGGSSVNAIEVIMEIKKTGISLEVEDFFRAKTIGELLNTDQNNTKQGSKVNKVDSSISGYEILFLNEATDEDIDDGSRMSAEAFANTEPATRALEIPVKEKIEAHLNKIRNLAYKNVTTSFLIRRKNDNKIAALCINSDLFESSADIPNVKTIPMRAAFRDSMEIQKILASELPVKQPKEWLFMDATAVADDEEITLKPSLQIWMENEKLKVARRYGFKGCCAAYSNPVTTEVAKELGYKEIASSGYIRDYEYDGVKYFSKIQPPHVKHICMVKYV